MTIAIGDLAPDFPFEDSEGRQRTLGEFRGGRPLVLYFYTKDDTPGCTTEARAFSDAAATFEALGVAVLGVSKDSTERHRKFSDKHRLTVALGSDAGQLCDAFGVWGERSMYGRTYMGIERATFLIDAGDRVVESWRKVKVKGHVESVIDAATRLASGATA